MIDQLPDAVKVLLVALGGVGAWPFYKNVIRPIGRILIRSIVRDYLDTGYVKQEVVKELIKDVEEFKKECSETSKEHNKQVANRVADLATQMQNFLARIVEIETKVGVFWKMIEQSTANLLHRDDTPKIDRLLEKLPAENLTDGERRELLKYLEAIEHGKGEEKNRPESRKTAAILLRASIISRYYPDEYGL